HSKSNHIIFLVKFPRNSQVFLVVVPYTHEFRSGEARGAICKRSALPSLVFSSVPSASSRRPIFYSAPPNSNLRKEKGGRFTPHQPPPRTKATQASSFPRLISLPLPPSSSLAHQLFQNPPLSRVPASIPSVVLAAGSGRAW
uniref:Uncharacterized protein n=1 Tax=Aegilops tauschii subsp. strangulata TaxID=200361 RepID=A0A452Z757_AEGTS